MGWGIITPSKSLFRISRDFKIWTGKTDVLHGAYKRVNMEVSSYLKGNFIQVAKFFEPKNLSKKI